MTGHKWLSSNSVLFAVGSLSLLYLLVMSWLMPRSHIHGSPRRFYYGLNLMDDPGNADFRSLIRMHYIRMIKYYYVWLRMQYGKLRTNKDCHECTSVANPASFPWMCDLGIIYFRRWCIDRLVVFHADQISTCLGPHLNLGGGWRC